MDSTTNITNTDQASLTGRARGMLTQVQRLSDQPGVRRALPGIALVAAAVIGLSVYMFLGQSSQMALFPAMPEADKARALDALSSSGIEANLDVSTGNIRVPSDDYHRAKMILATVGLPQGTPDGYATLSDMPMGTSRSVESARLRQMQELELARSITELQVVQAARVHLALPERTAFVRDTQPPRASVFLQLVQGRGIEEEQIRAIVSLVTTSIPGLTRANVSVVDQTGRLLSSESDDPINAMANTQMAHQMRLEALYRSRIESLITPIVGYGNAAVEVTLDMDFTRSEITREDYDPDGIALRSEQNSNQRNSSDTARGIPGAVSNTPPDQATLEADRPSETLGSGTQNGSSSSSETRNYEVSRRVETTQPASARILRINAAVLVRAAETIAGETGQEDTADTALLQDIERLTQTAIGFDVARGDTITVSSRPFIETFEPVSAAWYQEPWVFDVGRQAAQLLALAVIILGIVRPILNRVLLTAPVSPLASPSLGTPVEVAEGDSLQDLRRRLGANLDPDDFDGTSSYDAKVSLVRHLAESDTTRIATAFQALMEAEGEPAK
jgi:flagellar M-ring protein FliF